MDETYNENWVALFRVQGTSPDNMQAIQVDQVCFNDSDIFIQGVALAFLYILSLFTRKMDLENSY